MRKKTYNSTLGQLWFISSLLLIVSCQKGFEEEESLATSKSLKIETRSADKAPISYPLYLYAFNENGNCSAQQIIESESQSLRLDLPSGKFSIMAISGCSDEYTIPNNPKITDKVRIDNPQGAKAPMMMGKADITIGEKDASLNITLSYAVTAISVNLKGLPSDIASVSLLLSPAYSSMNMSGEYEEGNTQIIIPCRLDTENIWSAYNIYAFPGSADKTVMSILTTKKDGTEVTYAYTYNGKPQANRAFNINGNYIAGISVDGELVVKGWEEPIDVNFDFGAGSVKQPDNETDSDGSENNEGENEDEDNDKGENTDIPEVGSIWNDAIVVNVEDNNVLVMSLEEWACYADDLNALMGEIGIDGWDLPITSEAKLLNQTFQGSSLSMLNDLLWDNNYDQIDETKRYFYNHNGYIYAFGFKSSSRFQEAGLKTKYRLRLVKTIKLS